MPHGDQVSRPQQPLMQALSPLLPPAQSGAEFQELIKGMPDNYPVWWTNPPKFSVDMPGGEPVTQDYKDAFRQKYWWDTGNEGPAPTWDRPF